MKISRMKRKFAILMTMAMVLFWIPCENVFASNEANMTISGGVLTAYNGGGGAVTIPSSVTSIGANAFAGKPISSVSIPGSVTSIGDGAFANCTALANVTVPGSVTNMGSGGFSGCSGLSSVSMQASQSAIPASTVNGSRN